MTFWEDVRRGAETLVEEGQRMSRLARLKARVRALEAELGERVSDLGTRVLDLHRRNELHHYELDEVFVEIQALQRELRERNEEVERLLERTGGGSQSVATCPECAGRVRPGDRYCRHCGGALTGE